jgi:hypothetical protein
MPSGAEVVAIYGNYACVADGWGELHIISIADPVHPFEIAHWQSPGGVFDVAVSGNYAYVVADGLRIVSIGDPQNPSEVGYYATPGSSYGIAVSGNHVYVATGPRVQIDQAQEPIVYGWPLKTSIVRGVLNLETASKRQAGYRAELRDITGRMALHLHPGANNVSRLTPGVYFLSERQPGHRAGVLRVVVAK